MATNDEQKKADPLVLLREATIGKSKVYWSADHLEFQDGTRVHRGTKCGFRGSPKANLVDIGSIWYMFRETSADRSYTQESARKRGFQYLGVANRSDLCDYLVGHVDTCRGLVPDIIEGRKRPRDDPFGDYASVYRKLEGKPEKAASETALSSSVAPEDISYSDVMARVRPVKDLDVLVRCPGRMVPHAELILKIAQDEWKNWHSKEPRVKREHPGKIALGVELEEMIRTNRENLPIILVPCNKNAPVNLLNAQELLQHGKYGVPDEERMRFFESTRPEVVEVSRNIGGHLWTFEIRDSAKTFSKSQWLRTVAIVTDGSDWQFKGWPFESIVDLFTSIRGIYFQASGVPVPQHVHQWAVKILHLSPTHLDHRFSLVRDQFFMEIESFFNTCRVKKFVNHTTLEGGKRIILKPKPIL